jgi:phosphoglycolate phosphatase
MSYSTLLFDFDGTLGDTLPLFANSLRQFHKVLGYRLPDESMALAMRDMPPGHILTALGLARYKIPLLAILMRRTMRAEASKVRLFDGIETVLRHCRTSGIQLGIVSSNSRPFVRTVLERYELDIFRWYICGMGLGGKSRHLRRLLRRAQLNPAKTLYIGDEVRDIVAAKAAGIAAGAVSWGYNSERALTTMKPDYLFDSPGQILSLVSSPSTTPPAP